MYKIFFFVINNRLKKWSNEFDIIVLSQSGFRAGFLAIDNVFCLQSLIQNYLSKAGGRFYVLYIDFQKAFDSEDHYKVFTCLNKKGITGKFFALKF